MWAQTSGACPVLVPQPRDSGASALVASRFTHHGTFIQAWKPRAGAQYKARCQVEWCSTGIKWNEAEPLSAPILSYGKHF